MTEQQGALLVVDDNQINLEILSLRLEQNGFAVKTAINGETALELLAENHFDLILLDIMMPGISGIEILKVIRENHLLEDLPVIMVSAVSVSEEIALALNIGANDYVTKPVDFPVALARIQNQLTQKRTVESLKKLDVHNKNEVAKSSYQSEKDKSSSIFQSIPEFEFVEQIGQGGTSVVYKVRNKVNDRMEALKILHLPFEPDARLESILRIRREVTTLISLKNKHKEILIPEIYSFKEQENFFYYSMKHVEGDSLRKIMASKKLSILEAVKIVAKLAFILEITHAKGIIHRDIKPLNIIVDSSGCPWLVDFGTVKLMAKETTEITEAGCLVGTLSYMSPEQIKNVEITPQSDIYSLGVVFYEMLTSQPLVKERSLGGIVHRVLYSQPRPPSQWVAEVDKDLEQICLNMLSKDISHRCKNAKQLRYTLEEYLKYGNIRA